MILVLPSPGMKVVNSSDGQNWKTPTRRRREKRREEEERGEEKEGGTENENENENK